LLDDDVALLGEHPGDGVGGGEIAAMLLEQVAQLADRAVLVVGQDIDDDGRAARPVRFVLGLFVRDAGLFARAATDGALDVLGGAPDSRRGRHRQGSRSVRVVAPSLEPTAYGTSGRTGAPACGRRGAPHISARTSSGAAPGPAGPTR